MKIISGSAKGTFLKDAGKNTRATLSRLRTVLFDTISNDITDKKFLDCFAGTGSICLEALSRGAKNAVAIEITRNACEIIKENAANCNLKKNLKVIKTDFLRFIRTNDKTFDYIFIDPPRYKNLIEESLSAILAHPRIYDENTIIIIEFCPKEDITINENNFEIIKVKKSGNTIFNFLKVRDFLNNPC